MKRIETGKKAVVVTLAALLLVGCGHKKKAHVSPSSSSYESSQAASHTETQGEAPLASSQADPTPAPEPAESKEELWSRLEGVWEDDGHGVYVCFGDPDTNQGKLCMTSVIQDSDGRFPMYHVLDIEKQQGGAEWVLELEDGFWNEERVIVWDGDRMAMDSWGHGESDVLHKVEDPWRNFADESYDYCGYGQYMVTAEGGLRLRSGPGAEYEKIATIPYGEVIYEYGVVGTEEGGSEWIAEENYGNAALGREWMHTNYEGQWGWVSREYLLFHKDK